MRCNEKWEGVKTVRASYKPKRYARKDRDGNIVDLDNRAEATKEHLERDQWGSPSEQEQLGQEEQENRNTLERVISNLLDVCDQQPHTDNKSLQKATYN